MRKIELKFIALRSYHFFPIPTFCAIGAIPPVEEYNPVRSRKTFISGADTYIFQAQIILMIVNTQQLLVRRSNAPIIFCINLEL